MGSDAISAPLLKELARHQAWADAAHWKTLHESGALLDDAEIRQRLNHMLRAFGMLIALTRGETPDPSAIKDIESPVEIEAAMAKANLEFLEALSSVDLEKMIALPRGPKGPWEAPAGVLLLQAILHSQHHRGQNGLRMRQLGVKPPMTDFVIWYALGRPDSA